MSEVSNHTSAHCIHAHIGIGTGIGTGTGTGIGIGIGIGKPNLSISITTTPVSQTLRDKERQRPSWCTEFASKVIDRILNGLFVCIAVFGANRIARRRSETNKL